MLFGYWRIFQLHDNSPLHGGRKPGRAQGKPTAVCKLLKHLLTQGQRARTFNSVRDALVAVPFWHKNYPVHKGFCGGVECYTLTGNDAHTEKNKDRDNYYYCPNFSRFSVQFLWRLWGESHRDEEQTRSLMFKIRNDRKQKVIWIWPYCGFFPDKPPPGSVHRLITQVGSTPETKGVTFTLGYRLLLGIITSYTVSQSEIKPEPDCCVTFMTRPVWNFQKQKLIFG